MVDYEKAYNLVISELYKLKMQGIEVKTKRSISSYDENTINKYKHKTIPAEKWIHVNLIFNSVEHIKLIHNSRHFLGENGITFDTGRDVYGIDWEIDWSFKVSKDLKDIENKLNNQDWVEQYNFVFNEVM